ncbi:MAG: hypothetical protein IJ209_07150 [Bacteroidaceae bacterium]|nr:hypothetical protein [Bacteroidaceae bacterium]
MLPGFLSLYNCLLIALVAHYMMTAVISVFARHKVEYLSLAWILGIFATVTACTLVAHRYIEHSTPGILHPAMLLTLTATTFLQSIYPLSITMPGFLQWGRSMRYARPAIILFAIYGILLLVGHRPLHVTSFADIRDNLFTSDLILRFAMLALSIYYIVNIFRLPRVMLRNPNTPHYLFGYAFALGLSLCLYTWLTIDYSTSLLCIWTLAFTAVNAYLCFRTLETIAVGLPMPQIIEETEETVETAEAVETDEPAEEDFNEANHHRFEIMEQWMLHNRRAWRDFKFGRDQLCAATGINRYLMLQSVRSQGYYDIHEYISRHRIAEVERMIHNGTATTVQDCLDAGFASTKTLRSSFEKFTGQSLDAYLRERRPAK